MKILDRYVAKNFLVGYVIAFSVLIGLRVIIELFVNLDEFAELSDRGAWAVVWHVVTFYAMRITLYFRDIAGMITVVAAAFSLGKMVRANELVAIIASGVSAKRIVGPILVLAIFFTVLAIANQELLIPTISDKLVRDADDAVDDESYPVRFITDGNGSLINARRYYVNTQTLDHPTIILRRRVEGTVRWEVTGSISADKAVSDGGERWQLVNGHFAPADPNLASEAIASYTTPELLPRDIPVRSKSGFDALLSSRQLTSLAAQKTTIKDLKRLVSQKHFRITDPLINLTMLMISLPVLVCRDPKTMKSAVIVSFALTGACFVTTFACKMLATEAVFGNRIMPEFWPWVPLFIFVPIAIIELDSMRT